MKISSREKALVGVAGAFLLIFLIYAAVTMSGRSENLVRRDTSEDSISGLHAEVMARNDLKERLATAEERLGAKSTAHSFDEQTQDFVKALEAASSQNNIKFTSFNPRTTASRQTRTAGSLIQYEVVFAGSHGTMVNFVKALKSSGIPHNIETMRVKANAGNPDALEISMVISFYYLEPVSNETSA